MVDEVTHPHPVTGLHHSSPVTPGTGWPEDPADARTPIARTPADVRRLAAEATDLASLGAPLTVCRACPRLVTWREDVALTKRASFANEPYWGRPAPGWGDPAASVLIVGLAPAANGANRTGRVFTGDSSGDWLYASLHRTGFARQATARASGDGQALSAARIVAAVRCAPPANKPEPSERDTCAPWLVREWELLRPTLRVVVALGAFGWQASLRALGDTGHAVPRPVPKFGHAAEVTMSGPGGGSVTLLGCYHPSQHNTFTGRLTPEMLDGVFRRARILAGLDA